MNKKIKILLTNTGRRTYFINFLTKIKIFNNDLDIHISDCTYDTSSFYSKKFIKKLITPQVKKDQKNYIEILLSYCKKNNINFIIPLTDLDLILLAKNENNFLKIKTKIISNNLDIIKICENKLSFNKFLKNNNFLYPKYSKNLKDFKNTNFKIVEKKINGSGSDDQSNYKNVSYINSVRKDFFLSKFIDGKEYGIDILNDKKGNFVSCCIKEKIHMRSGETDKAKIVEDENILNFSKKLSLSLNHRYNIDCDIIVDKKGSIYCLDINPRFGGGYAFTHLSGLNYIKYILYDELNLKYKLKKKPKKIIGMKSLSLEYYSNE